MTKDKKAPTTDALEILQRRLVAGDAAMQARVDQERANARIAQAIYDLRIGLGLSQRALAKKAGTTASVICRLEDAAYGGHSTAMLERIAAAAGHRLEIDVRFVPAVPPKAAKKMMKPRKSQSQRVSTVRSRTAAAGTKRQPSTP